jgi:hypothetical protein
VSLSRRVFRASVGTTLRFRLSKPARLTLRIERAAGSRWRGLRGSIAVAGREGANAVRVRGRIGGRTLRAGRYRLVISLPGRPPIRARIRIVAA